MIGLLTLAAVLGLQLESPGTLLEQAYFLEQAEGDLTGAVAIYQRVVDEFPEERAFAARALFRIGLCHERLGYDRASATYRRLVTDYPDQVALVRLAEDRLEALSESREGERVDLPTGASLREIVLADRNTVGDALASLSPKAARLAYEDDKIDRLVIFDLRRRRAQLSVALPGRSTEGPYRWSHDGMRLAFDELSEEGSAVRTLDIENGATREIFRADYATVVGWGADDRSLFVHAFSTRDETSRLVHLRSGGDVVWETRIRGRSFRISPNAELVAFTGEEGDDDIYVARLPRPGTTTEPAPVTPESAIEVAPHAAEDRYPIWSPDGSHLAFLSNRASSWDLWVVALGPNGIEPGTPRVLETSLGEGARLRDWLSDGKLVLTRPRVMADVWIQPVSPATGKAAGSSYLAPTEVRGQNAQPRWSPDGRRLSIRSQREFGQSILTIASLDDEPERLVRLPTEFQNAAWTPDGRGIIYCAFGEDGLFLAGYDVGTGESFTYTPGVEVENVFAPSLSPDGREMLFGTSDDREALMQFLLDTESGAIRKVPNTETIYAARWSPDGQWIAFADGESVCVLRPDGSGKRCLARVEAPYRINAWIAWSPDGRLVVYPKGSYVGDRFDWDLSIVSFDGATHELVGEATELSPWWVDWSPDGRHLALSSTTGSHGLWVLEGFSEPMPPR